MSAAEARAVRHQLIAANTHRPPTPPDSTQENQGAALTAKIRVTSCAHLLNLAHLESGTEASDQRACSHEVFFFLFVVLDKLIISSLSYQVSQEQHGFVPISSLLALSTPWDCQGPSPALLHTLELCTALLTSSHQALAPAESWGLFKAGCRHAARHLFLLLFS